MKTLATVCLALMAVLLSGCGTIVNLCSGDPEVPFGGVQKDLAVIGTQRTTSMGSGTGAALIAVLIPAELCLSLAGDTLTWPLAVFLKRLNYSQQGSDVDTVGSTSNSTNANTDAAPSDNEPALFSIPQAYIDQSRVLDGDETKSPPSREPIFSVPSNVLDFCQRIESTAPLPGMANLMPPDFIRD